MSNFVVSKTGIQAGIWEGVIERAPGSGNDGAPTIEVQHLGQPVHSFSVTSAGGDRWQLRIAIPPDVLCDGVQVFLILDAATGDKLDTFTIVTGEPLEDDIRAEVSLLRAELDMLKRAFRRHCLES